MKKRSILAGIFCFIAASFGVTEANAAVDTSGLVWKLETATALEKTDASYQYLMGDYNHDSVKDLYVIKRNGVNNSTEVHILDGNTDFKTFLLRTRTVLGTTDLNSQFQLGDLNNDGALDLYCIKKQGVSSTELHVLNGKNNFQSFILQTATALGKTDGNWSFLVGDYNKDKIQDLYAIKKNGANGTEVHVLNGASNFTTYSLNIKTGLGQTNSQWEFGLSDYDKDGTLDLYSVRKDGALSSELHVLKGNDNFQSFHIHTNTPMAPADVNTQFVVSDGDISAIKGQGVSSTEVHKFGFNVPVPKPTNTNGMVMELQTSTILAKTGTNWEYLSGDYNKDGINDLYAIKKDGATSTEVHVLNGKDNFKSYLLETNTIQTPTDANWQFELGDYNNDGTLDIIGIKKMGVNSTELHIMNGNGNFQSYINEMPTKLGKTDSGWSFMVGDYNNDKILDLYAIKRVGVSSTEVHILNGSTSYSTFLLEAATPLGITDGNWDFALNDNNKDSKLDIYAIRKDGKLSSEVHILNGQDNFQTFALHSDSPMPPTDIFTQFIIGQDDMFAIKGQGVSSTEVHRFSLPIVQKAVEKVYVTAEQLKQLGWHNITEFSVTELNNTLKKFDITTPERIRHFLSQCCKESGLGVYTIWAGTTEQFEGRLDIGNNCAGDGAKYRPAGYIQMIGKSSYQRFADYIGDQQVMTGYAYVAEKYPWTSAGFWWYLNGMNARCDAGASVAQITRIVTGGSDEEEIEDRTGYYNTCCQIFK